MNTAQESCQPSRINSKGMSPEISDWEQGKEVEMVPTGPEPEQQEERDVTPQQDYSHEVLSKLQPLRAKIAQLLGPAGPRRVVVTGDAGWHCLAFVESELSNIAAFLTTLSPQHLDDFETKKWWQHGYEHHRLVKSVLREVDPLSHTLLRRALQCFHFHRRKSYSFWLFLNTLQLYYINENPSRYRHLLISSDLGLTPHLAEVGALLPLVGIDRPAKKIFRWFTHQGNMDTSLRVMSIVGPVGIGKTTLAVEVRNRLIRHETSSRGHHYFHCNVMVQASRRADRNILLLQDILSQVSDSAGPALSSHQSQCNTMELLLPLVSECLQRKRYFIIIDDLWEESDWVKIKGAFPNNLGSRILITTRATSVAEACCSGSYDGLVHEVKALSEVDSERLLLAKAVGSMDDCLPNNMKLHYDEILRRCDGTPLFIICMANWLKEQRLQQLQQREHEDEEHHRFPIYFDEQVPRLPEWLEQALYSAFSDFSNDGLRLLLLYFSMFPYGYKFEKDRLILKWKDEGLLNRGDATWLLQDSVMEARAESFFSQLQDRNVITCVPSTCKHKQDEANACQWHVNHFMQQLLASKSAEMGFIFTTTTLNLVAASAADRANETSSKLPRRLALHHQDPQLPSLLETMDLSQTRSLAVSGTVSGIPLDKFANLVVLDLEGWENLKDQDLVQVCRSKMIFLRYFSVRNTRVSKLPRDIKELQILSTLDVSHTQITELPLELFELTYLEHLDLRGTWISQLPKQIAGLQLLTGLLVGGGEGTINSVEAAARVPNDVWRLQTLATVDLTRHPASFVRALGDLYSLRPLAVTWSFHQSTDRDYCEAFLSLIKKWRILKSLAIHCGLGCSMDFLGSLEKSGAPQELEKFKVTTGRFTTVPRWMDGLKCLAFVQITVCNKQTMTDDLQILGALPKLQCLILGLDFIPGQPIAIENEGFHELQRFSVDCPMPWLTFSTGAMLKLTYLQLKFSSTPASEICVPSGISNLRRLTEVALCYNVCYINSPSVKMTVEAVTQQVAEHRNPIDLFINGFELDDVQEVDDEVTENTIGTSSRTNAGADAQAVSEEATAVAQCEITEAES